MLAYCLEAREASSSGGNPEALGQFLQARLRERYRMPCNWGRWELKQLKLTEKDYPNMVKEIRLVSYFQRRNTLKVVSSILSYFYDWPFR